MVTLIDVPFYSSEGCPGVSKLFMQPSPPPGVRVKQKLQMNPKEGNVWGVSRSCSVLLGCNIVSLGGGG